MLPMRFEAVGEALVVRPGRDVRPAHVVGRDVARDGAALGEALSGLRTTYRAGARVVSRTSQATEALSVAWSEATLEYLHDLSCEDPLTGLTSLAHVRTRLAELYRDAELTDVPVRESHALVVVEVRYRAPGPCSPTTTSPGRCGMVQVAEATRSVYSGGQTLGRLGLNRAVAVVGARRRPRHSRSPCCATSSTTSTSGRPTCGSGSRGCPASADSATRLLDELAR